MEYKDFFSPKTLEKLNKKSAENLKAMLGDKNLMQTIMSSQQLLNQISKAEAPYKAKLEKLAVDMVKELYPIIDEEGIILDAKIGDIESVTGELDEIKVNKPGKELTRKEWSELINGQQNKVENFLVKLGYPKNSRHLYVIEKNLKSNEKSQLQKILKQNLTEAISPESRRRIINAITQGAALRGAFAFYLFKEHLDDLDSSLVEKYNQIMKNSFGIYDDENAIAMMLAALAQGQKMAGGGSKVILKEIKVSKPFYFQKGDKLIPKDKRKNKELTITGEPIKQIAITGIDPVYAYFYPYITLNGATGKISEPYLKDNYKPVVRNKTNESQINEAESGITIYARAICFPMLVHELIKGLWELISLQGFKGDKAANQAVVDKVDLLKNEPTDIRYGKFIYDALNDIFANSDYNDSRIREFFFIEVYQLNDDEFISFIENAINEELTPTQQKWAKDTLRDIAADLRADDFDATGIKEIKIEKPGGFFNKFGEIDAVENEFEGAMQTGDYTQEEYLEELIHISEENLEDLNGGYYEIAKILNNLKNSEKKIAIQNIKKWAQNTLKNPLKEIKINNLGQSILFGLDSNNKFTELIKIKGFKTLNKALNAIQKTLNPTSYNHEDLFHLDKQNPEDSASDMKYAYISGDGSVYFIKDLSEFDDGYNTEEEWGVVKWSKTLNEIKINKIDVYLRKRRQAISKAMSSKKKNK